MTGLHFGEAYTLTEIRAADGYALADDITFRLIQKVDEDGNPLEECEVYYLTTKNILFWKWDDWKLLDDATVIMQDDGSPQNYSPLCGERGIAASFHAGIPRCPALWLATITTAPCCGKLTTERAQSAATFCCVRIFCCSADTSSRQNSYGKTILKLWMNCWPTKKMQKSKSNSLPASAKFYIGKSVSRNMPRGKKKSNH